MQEIARQTKKPWYKTPVGIVIILFFILLIVLGILAPDTKKVEATTVAETNKDSSIAAEAITIPFSKTFATNYESLNNDLPGSNDPTGIAINVGVLNAYSQMLQEATTSTNEDVQKLKPKFKSRLIERQTKLFPILRKQWADNLKDALWKEDIYVTLEGPSNNILNITGGVYAANKNIQATQETIIEMMRLLRFKEVRYRWYKNASEFTYYKTEAIKDYELMYK